MRVSILVASLWLAASAVTATPYWTPEDASRAKRDYDAARERPEPPVVRGAADDVEAFLDATWFIASMQVTDSLSADFGGIREGEHLLDIIQTDNTSESIWMFTRYWEITGDDAIFPHLDASWTYVLNHPAYAEEGDSFPHTGYYRYYNCGWALRAGLLYETVFSDLQYAAYVDSCAQYLATHTLQINGMPGFIDDVNPPVLAWGGGNLRAYGVAKGDSLWTARGWLRGERVKGWVETRPELLGTEEWAMSGGATMWGLLESYFDEFPAEEAAWVATYAPNMDTFSSPGQWENAWQGWYALGATRLEESTGEASWGSVHRDLTDYLLSFDATDQDGGIPAHPDHLDTEDQAWVTAYLGFMGLHPILVEATSAPVLASPAPPRFVNHPNPFGAVTAIEFDAPSAGTVSLDVFDVTGARVRSLAAGYRERGAHSVSWDGRDAAGRRVPAGVYFARLVLDDRTRTRKLIVFR